jgi:hypothetical protein
MTDGLIPEHPPALSDPRAAVQALLSKLLEASTDPSIKARDGLAFAVHEHAKQLREVDPAAVTPRMIQAAEMLAEGAAALSDAVTAAREVLDEELTVLGADKITGKVQVSDPLTGEPVVDPATGETKTAAVYVTGTDGTRYKLIRGHVETKLFNDAAVVRLIATALRASYVPPAGTPGFLAGAFGEAYEAGVADGAAQTRRAIGTSGTWLVTVLEPLANQLASAGDLAGAGLLRASMLKPKITIKETARFERVKARN